MKNATILKHLIFILANIFISSEMTHREKELADYVNILY